jgi:hypothetical protein
MESALRKDRRTLGLFAKQPRPGYVKSRLAAETSASWAARVADAFLRDSVHRLASVAAQRVIAFTPPEAQSFFAEVAEEHFSLEVQADGDLGDRMRAFISRHLGDTADRIVVLGADSPTLPLHYIEQAFNALENDDVVLGPATDGGYYLLGCARRVPPIFDGIAWGSSEVLAQTTARLRDAAWHTALLPPWYDVDTLTDWRALREHVQSLRRAGLDPGVPHTEALILEDARRRITR